MTLNAYPRRITMAKDCGCGCGCESAMPATKKKAVAKVTKKKTAKKK